MASLGCTAAHPAVPHRLGHRRCSPRKRHSVLVVHAVSSRTRENNEASGIKNNIPTDGQPERKHVVIVGGGMAGLGCLYALRGIDTLDVTLLESKRVVGGRVRSKTALGALQWDTGAAYFTTKNKNGPFAKALDAAVDAGVVQLWDRDAEGDNVSKPGMSMGTASTSESNGRVTIDNASFIPFKKQKKQLFVGVPSAAAFPKFIAEQYIAANFPEASWVGDNREIGVPEILCGAHVDRVKELGDGAGTFWPVHPHGSSPKKRWGFMTRCKEGGHMWYKPLECDFVVFASNAFATHGLLQQMELGNPLESGETEINESSAGETSGSDSVAALSRLTDCASKARSASCWSLTIAFDAPLNLKYDALKLTQPFTGHIVWLANESSKPGRGGAAQAGWGYRWAEVGRAPTTGTGECWVAQASPEWSARHLELNPTEAAEQLCAVFLSLIERDGVSGPKPVHVKATRWRFAFPLIDENETDDHTKNNYLFEPALGVGACGDWVSGPRAGDAYESGAAMGNAVATHLVVKDVRE